MVRIMRLDAAALMAHRAAVRGTALRLVGRHDVDDLEQEVWLRALAARDAPVESPQRLRRWLLAVARNACTDELRRRYRRPAVALDGSECARDQHAVRQDLDDALQVLPPEQRALLELRHCQGYSIRDLAARSAGTYAAVSQRLFRARRAVRDHAAQSA